MKSPWSSELDGESTAVGDPVPAASHAAGTTVGAAGGAVAGATIGAVVGGPVGAVVGGAVGAVAGGAAGYRTAEVVTPTIEDTFLRDSRGKVREVFSTSPGAPYRSNFVSLDEFLDSLTAPDPKHSLSSDEAAAKIRATRETVNELRRVNKLLAFQRGRSWRYPSWQFSSALPKGYLEGIDQVRAALRVPDGSLAFWLVHPKKQLDGDVPIRLLGIGRLADVVEAAERASADI